MSENCSGFLGYCPSTNNSLSYVAPPCLARHLREILDLLLDYSLVYSVPFHGGESIVPIFRRINKMCYFNTRTKVQPIGAKTSGTYYICMTYKAGSAGSTMLSQSIRE